jgi:hypothetical protein
MFGQSKLLTLIVNETEAEKTDDCLAALRSPVGDSQEVN